MTQPIVEFKFDKVSLFSGGMDSLISTINLMEEKKNTLLISHAYSIRKDKTDA